MINIHYFVDKGYTSERSVSDVDAMHMFDRFFPLADDEVFKSLPHDITIVNHMAFEALRVAVAEKSLPRELVTVRFYHNNTTTDCTLNEFGNPIGTDGKPVNIETPEDILMRRRWEASAGIQRMRKLAREGAQRAAMEDSLPSTAVGTALALNRDLEAHRATQKGSSISIEGVDAALLSIVEDVEREITEHAEQLKDKLSKAPVCSPESVAQEIRGIADMCRDMANTHVKVDIKLSDLTAPVFAEPHKLSPNHEQQRVSRLQRGEVPRYKESRITIKNEMLYKTKEPKDAE